ncbi:MAG: alpha/beta hydrolase fold domain-containing protein [Trueperaceae bacterium]|nr:alpha/beta hydrolase fold domain-containing protein [Trueperaceae bacterium]
MTPDRRAVHPDLRRAPLAAVPFHWRWALPFWRWATGLARPVPRAGVDVADHAEAGVPVRVYRPQAGAAGGALLWLHGGGLIVGRPAMDDGRCVGWARELGLVVVSVDYRLAPEHPFPAALDDAHAAWTWLQASTGTLRVDPARLAVGGASAGAGLAACLAQRLRDEGGVQPAAQLLVYPMLDDRTAARRELDGGHLVWSNRSNRTGWSAYLGGPAGAPDLPAYAVAARCDDLGGLPPAWIGVGALGLFLEEDRAYAARLRAAGVATELLEVPGAPHGFDALAPDVPLSRDFAAAQTAFLCDRLVAAPARRIEVVEADPAWAVRFEELRAMIAPALDGIALAIEHVGSTAVPGLAAKPIVDLDVVVADEATSVEAIARLERLGYRHVGDRGVPGREAFERPPGTPPHHLYVRRRAGVALENHLRLHDRPRADPERARAYGDLKRRLAEAHPDDIDAYVAGKTAFIADVLREEGMAAADLDEVEAANRPR